MGGEPELDVLGADRGDWPDFEDSVHRLPIARAVVPGYFAGADPVEAPARADARRAKQAGASAAAVLLATVASLLPERWRDRAAETLPVVGGTMVSGFAQLLGGALLFIDGVLAMRAAAGASGLTTYASSLDAYLELLFSPYGALCVYLFAEGTLRFIGAAVLNEPHGTLPTWLIQQLVELARDRHADLKLGRRVADRVTVAPADCDLRIETCRPRTWDDDTAIEYEHRYYEVQQVVQLDAGPHRFVYRLRRRPIGKILRRIHHYAPDELLPLRRRVEPHG